MIFRRRRGRRIRGVGTRRIFWRSCTVKKRQKDRQCRGHAPWSGMSYARQRVNKIFVYNTIHIIYIIHYLGTYFIKTYNTNLLSIDDVFYFL